MLIDIIPIKYLPHWIVWLDWHVFTHTSELIVCIFLATIWFSLLDEDITQVRIAFWGFVWWTFWCLIKYGEGV